MKKPKLLKIFAAILFAALSSFSNSGDDSRLNFVDDFTTLFPLNEIEQLWVEETLAGMTLKEKCAQMIISYASGRDTSVDSKQYRRLEKLVSDFKVGGLIFFNGDVRSQVKLTNRLQSKSKIPLLIASDYERGLGTRLDDAVDFPYNMAIGAANDTYLTYLMGKTVGEESRAMGVHQIYAPLLDVNHDFRNPIVNIRAFSEDPNIISWHGNSFIKGVHEEKVLTTAKHFPGHGSTDIDSHSELPMIYQTEDDFYRIDLVPFIEAINAGVKSIMIGHLEIPTFEEKPHIPATFSRNIITGLLKNKLNFDGLVITDAMNMRAIIDSFSQDIAAKLAVQAGNDMILFPLNDSLAIKGIYDGVLNNEISLNQLNHSVRKILSAKKWLNIEQTTYIDTTNLFTQLNNPSHKRLSVELAEKSITLVKDFDNLIPLNLKDYRKISCITLSDTRLSRSIKKPFYFEKMLEAKSINFDSYRLNLSSKPYQYKRILKSIRKSDLILLPVYVSVRSGQGTIAIDEDQLDFINAVLKLNKPTVIMSFGNPYIFAEFQDAETYLCSYGSPDISEEAMFNAITGNIKIEGKLPVSIPTTNYTIGYGVKKNLKKLPFISDSSDTNYNWSAVDSIMMSGVSDSVFPGGVLLVGHRDRVVYHKPLGKYSYDSIAIPMSTKAMFDLASLTKVVGTTSASMMLYDQLKIDLDDLVIGYLPEFDNHGKDKITIKHLLTHNSGLPAFKRYYTMYETKEEIINDIMNTELIFTPGTDYTYSDLGMITMQLIIEKVIGTTIDKFLRENLFDKLEMNRTMYNPPPELWYYCVPTEIDKYWRYTTVKGKVHDENAFMLGGVAGHAGLFSTASDIAKLLFVYLNDGMYNDSLFFNPSTIREFTSLQTKFGDRGLGWGIKSVDSYSSAGSKLSASSFGHTGFTGTSIWVDPENDLFVVLLTNRVHPTRENHKIFAFRQEIHDAVSDAISYR